MVFSSIQFLCYFLPATLLFVFLSPRRFQNAVLLVASLFFYAYGEGLYVLLMLGLVFVDWGIGVRMTAVSDVSPATPSSWRARPICEKDLWLVFGLVVNLGTLFLFKYENFLLDSVNTVLLRLERSEFEWEPIHLPIGISFFTFQSISYLIDVYRKTAEPQKNFIDLALYIMLFPQLIAGPIIRYNHIAHELRHRYDTTADRWEDWYEGTQRFVFGLAKKVLLANSFAIVADHAFSLPCSELSVTAAWLGIVCYTLQIYYDFVGYSDMAIGLGRMFGFRFPENFNYPYIAVSMQDFWRRWHISLSSWFRDYLYIPLGGNRCGSVRTLANLFIVFFLTGLWHGAGWTFVIWGLFHGFFLVFERLGGKSLLERAPITFRHCYTLLVVMVAWVFFRADDMPHAIAYLQCLFGTGNAAVSNETSLIFLMQNFDRQFLATFLPGLVLVTPIAGWLRRRLHFVPFSPILTATRYCYICILLGLLFASMAYLAAGTYNPFIYFRF